MRDAVYRVLSRGLTCVSFVGGMLAAGTLPAHGEVVCDQFDVRATLVGADKLSIHVDTDLPDSTVLMVTVGRSYWEKGSDTEYAVDYFSDQSTVGKWRTEKLVAIDNSVWMRDLEAKRRNLAKIGMGFDVDRIDEQIEVLMLVPILGQTDPRFGKGNKDLVGKAVPTSGLAIVKDERRLDVPLEERPNAQSYGDPNALKVGETYAVSDRTPVMPHYDPPNPLEAIARMQNLEPGGTIGVREVRNVSGNPWYGVDFRNPDGSGGEGWINSKALGGQELLVK